MGLLSTQPLTWATSLLTTAIVPRYLGEEGFGQLAVITIVTTLSGTVASLGVHDYIKRRIATQPARAAAEVSAALLLLVATATVLGAALFVGLPIFGFWVEQRPVLAVALCGTVVQAAQSLVLAVLVGQERHGCYAWLNAAGAVISSFTGIGVLVAGGGLLGYLSSSTIVGVAMTAVLWRTSGLQLVTRGAMDAVPQLVAGGLPFLGWKIALLVRGQIDVILVGILLQAQVAGWLAAAYRIINVVVFIPTAVATPLLPVLSREVGNPAVFERTLRRCVTTVLTLTIPASGFIIALAPVVPDLLQWAPGFRHAVPVIMILAIQQPLVALDMVLGTALTALRREHGWLRVMLIASAFNPCLNLLIIPLADRLLENGAIGAAIIEIATELLIVAGVLIVLPRGLLNRQTVWQCVRIMTAGVCLVIVTQALRDVWLPLSVMAGGIAFLTTGFMLGVVTPGDIRLLRQHALRSLSRNPAAWTGAEGVSA
jgi:O-antigen/teichoic acid export membrane protein